ncbi:hypothetical protein [Rubritalea tangerina]
MSLLTAIRTLSHNSTDTGKQLPIIDKYHAQSDHSSIPRHH